VLPALKLYPQGIHVLHQALPANTRQMIRQQHLLPDDTGFRLAPVAACEG
jgi:hypothetical protein